MPIAIGYLSRMEASSWLRGSCDVGIKIWQYENGQMTWQVYYRLSVINTVDSVGQPYGNVLINLTLTGLETDVKKGRW